MEQACQSFVRKKRKSGYSVDQETEREKLQNRFRFSKNWCKVWDGFCLFRRHLGPGSETEDGRFKVSKWGGKRRNHDVCREVIQNCSFARNVRKSLIRTSIFFHLLHLWTQVQKTLLSLKEKFHLFSYLFTFPFLLLKTHFPNYSLALMKRHRSESSNYAKKW